MTEEVKEFRYLGVRCQNCGEPIMVPARLLDRQIVISEDASEQCLTTLLNLRCKACFTEHFYDAAEILEMQGKPPAFASRLGRHYTMFRPKIDRHTCSRN
jgi:hypothetical protein